MADISVVPAFCPSLISGMFCEEMRAGSGHSASAIVPKPSSYTPLLDDSIVSPFSVAAVSPKMMCSWPWCS
jgi:hypothetical protein